LYRFLSALLLLFLTHCLYAQLTINEFNCKRGFTDENGEDVDWIEIYNPTSDSIFLGNYYLSDKLNNLDKWQFPDYYIQPQEISIVCASGNEYTKFPHHWESLVKANNIWKYRIGNTAPPNNWNSLAGNDQNWNAGQGGIGYGDNDDNTIITSTPSLYLRKTFTISDMNDITQLLFHADYDDGFIAYLNGTEIMRSSNFNNFYPNHNDYTNVDHEAVLYNGGIPESKFFNTNKVQELLINGTNLLAIQVHNASANSSDMSSNFFLSAGISSSNYTYQTLPNWINPPTVYPHTNFKLSHGETISISDLNEIVIDQVQIPMDITNQVSRGRIPDGNGNWCYFRNPSPNVLNDQNTCFTGFTGDPISDIPSGWYQGTIQVNVTSPPNATTYYTTNGDVPDSNDTQVNGPISINSNSVLSIRSFSNNTQYLPSNTLDFSYFINEENHNLPVFSIITNYDNLWNWYNGIYVSGPNAGTNYPFFGSNFWQPWSKKSRLEFFDSSKTKQFEADFDLEIHGGWSRAEPQKSFRIDTKSIYTGDIDYTLIKKKPEITSYNNFNLRNGGQHTWSDRIQDAIISRLAKNSNIDRMGYEPCIVYLNGAYWGLYGIREKIDEHYVESNHGVNSSQVDLLNRDSALSGSSNHFAETFYMLEQINITDANYMNVFKSRFDLNNYLDYFIFQTYIQNMDWLGIAWGLNNVKLWRNDIQGGKWRYVLYDTDAAFGYFGQNVNDNYLTFARYPSAPNEHASIFNRSLLNPEFKCLFTNRYDDLINTTFQPSNFNSVSEELKNKIESAIPDHITRWSGQVGPYSYTQWVNSINNIKQYNSLRIHTARQHLNQTLSLDGEKQVNLSSSPVEGGIIKINTITPDLPWEGIYHGGCPVNIKAIPNADYIFSHWYSNSSVINNSPQDSMEVSLTNDTYFTAIFTTCQSTLDVNIEEIDNQIIPTISNRLSHVQYEWLLNENIISFDSVIENPTNGVYQLVIRYDSCTIRSNLMIVDNDEYNIHLFPNPARDQFNLQFVIDRVQDIEITFYNSIGQEVFYEKHINFLGQFNKMYDVSSFAKEVYIVSLKTKYNIYTEKVVLTE